jgi:hypothetical protein
MDKIKKSSNPECYASSSQIFRIYWIVSALLASDSRFVSAKKSTSTPMAFSKSQHYFLIFVFYLSTPFHSCISNVFKHWTRVSCPLKHIHRQYQQSYAHFRRNYCIHNLIWICGIINVLWEVVVGVGVCLCEYRFDCDIIHIVLYMNLQIQTRICMFFHLTVCIFVYYIRESCFIYYEYADAIKYSLNEDGRIGVHYNNQLSRPHVALCKAACWIVTSLAGTSVG